MRKVEILLALVLSPLMLQAATFGPEIAAARPEHFSAFGTQTANAIACGDQSCVALWHDSDGARRGLYSSVIDASGIVHPASSNVISLGEDTDGAIVWTGDHYLATWLDFDHGTLNAAPLSSDGRLLSGAPVQVVSTFPYSAGGNALAWNGSHAFAVFDTDKFWSATLDANGHVVGNPRALPATNATKWGAAASGQTFALIWVESFQSTSMVKFERFNDAGSPIDTAPVTLAENLPVQITSAGIAGNATQFGAAYAPAVDSSISRLRIDASTGAIDRLPVVTFGRQVSGVYWSGDDFVAYGSSANTIVTQRFSSDAVHVFNVSSPSDIFDSRLAPAPFGAVAIWSDSRLGADSKHVFGSLLDTDATAIVKGNISVSVSTLPQAEPALAPSGNGALLVWSQQHDGTHADIVARRLSPAGAPIDDSAVTLATNVWAGRPTAVWLGNAWLVVWQRFDLQDLIVGKRVSASGEVLDANPIEFAHGFPHLVTNGSLPLLAFWNGNGVSVLRLNANGNAIDSQPITITTHEPIDLAAGTNGDEFLLAWSEYSEQVTQVTHVYGARLSSSGQPIDSVPIAIDTGARSAVNPAIASDGRDFLIVYSDPRIVTKRLLAEGSLAGSTAQDEGIVVDPDASTLNFFVDPKSPAVAWNGSGYVIVWSIPQDEQWTVAWIVAATTVDRTGAPIDNARALSRTETAFDIKAAAANVQGTVIVAYPRPNAEDGVPQVVTRQVLSGSPRGRGIRR
ncbi:MAG TPA: hypothetical protein VGR95_01900 [Thermoanaerobaculia bacterium]|jgi:hypothetical protein|nr:hypothetical protein [Thermoanaerobaculia bacterium]